MRSLEPVPYVPQAILTPESDPVSYAHYWKAVRLLGGFATLSQSIIDTLTAKPELGGLINYNATFRPNRGVKLVYRNPFVKARVLPYTIVTVVAAEKEEKRLLQPGFQLVFDDISVRLPGDGEAPISVVTDMVGDEYLRLTYPSFEALTPYLDLDFVRVPTATPTVAQ